MTYFERSQEIRQKLLLEEDMLTQTRRAFNGEIEKFGSGSNADLYRIGKLYSGLYVALRVFGKEGYGTLGRSSLGTQKYFLEDYCQNAEELDTKGEEVPKFCVGVVYRRRAGILTEDLTANGIESFVHPSDCAFAWVGNGANARKVFVDIDNFFRSRKHDLLKYFLRKHLILL